MDNPPRAPWAEPIEQLTNRLDTDLERGLTAADAAGRLERDGPNEIAAGSPTPWWRRLGRQFADPLVILLLVAIGISLIAWWTDGATATPLEAIVIAAIVVLNAGIGYWQESKAIEAVAALRRLTTTRSTVLRDARAVSVPTTDLVVGDVIVLAEGDAVGADCRLTDVASLQIAEASLTGESAAVLKSDRLLDAETSLAERSNMAFSGTAVVRGRGEAVVVATAMGTEIGRIARLIDDQDHGSTPLQEQIRWLGRQLGIAVLVLSTIVVAAIVVTSDTRSFTTVVEALLVGVSLAVAAVPEGLPAILSVVLALGVQRMAAEHAIVKRLSSVETLGSASVICTDKTGTLTRNEMTIVEVVVATGRAELTGVGYQPVGHVVIDGERLHDEAMLADISVLLSAGSMANDASLHEESPGRWEVIGDPTEIAFLVAEEKVGAAGQRRQRFERVAEIPFSSERRRMTTVHRDAEHDHDDDHGDHGVEVDEGRDGGGDRVGNSGSGGGAFVLVMKGAPDVMLARCTHERAGGATVELSPERRAAIAAEVDRLADHALRTIAVGYKRLERTPATFDEHAERELVHLGVVGILDPPRPEVAASIAEAHDAGIRVIMLTGDHPVTAARIGATLGVIEHDGRGVDGTELARQDDDGFQAMLRTHSVFARVEPEHKLRIVEVLQADGQIVAMTGDGVNDAPALRRADIGVAMGVTGTEVSKEAADMILADDNFATILRAVREGREIFADIRKVLRYLLASNTGEVLVMLIGVLGAGAIGLHAVGNQAAVPLLATQILWINLLTDGALALALGVDPAVENVMDRPPRRASDHVIDRDMLVTIVLIGLTAAVAALLAFDLRLPGGIVGNGGDLATARTMAFTTLVLGQVFNAFNARSDHVSAFVRPWENRVLWASIGVTVALQVAVVHVGFLQRAFDTAPLDVAEWALCLALASAVLWVDEIRKLVDRRRTGPQRLRSIASTASTT
jgi:magnesium-transporting ATPase (P-type)